MTRKRGTAVTPNEGPGSHRSARLRVPVLLAVLAMVAVAAVHVVTGCGGLVVVNTVTTQTTITSATTPLGAQTTIGSTSAGATGSTSSQTTGPTSAGTTGSTKGTTGSTTGSTLPVPTITSVSPSSGDTSGGNSVTITGTMFTGDSAVTFGGTKCTSVSVNPNGREITVVAPAHATGKVDVVVTTGGGSSVPSSYTYLEQMVTVITGALVWQHFEETDAHLVWAGTWITGTSPENSGGSGLATNAAGASVTIKFSGQRIRLIAAKSPTCGYAKITLDNLPAVTVDFYAQNQLFKQTVWYSGPLASGNHVVTMEWTGQSNSAAADTYIDLDAIDILGGSLQ